MGEQPTRYGTVRAGRDERLSSHGTKDWGCSRGGIGAATVLLLSIVACLLVPPGGGVFYVRHRAFLLRVYGAVGVPPGELRHHLGQLEAGAFAPTPVGVTRVMVRRALGAPDNVGRADPGGKIPSPPQAVATLYYRDRDAVACFDVDERGNVLVLRTYDVDYFD